MAKYLEGPGILFVPIETLMPTDEPTFMITTDEKYWTELFAAKFGLQVQPRKEN